MACLVAAPRASAQYSTTQEFQTGFSLLRFEPAKPGDRFFAVPDAFVPGNSSSRFRALVLADFATAPILSRTDNTNGQTVNVISHQFLTHFGVGYLPIDQLLLSADVPLAVSQSGESTTTPSGAALGDTRLGVRYGLVGSENAEFSLAPALDVWLPTGSQDKLTGDGKLRGEPSVTFGGREAAFIWSAQLGYQFRRHIDIGSVEIGNSFAFGAAAGVLLFDDVLQVGPELYGATLTAPSQGSAFGSQNTVLEALFGAKVRAGDFAFGASAGPGLARAPGTAPRVLLSIAFAPQAPYVPPSAPLKPDAAPTPPPPPPDGDEDGIADADDACPAEKGKASDDKAKNGCPAAPLPAPAAAAATPPPGEEDTDGDGVPDNEDACKRVKGVASDTPKLNGCPPPPPPVDTDGDGVADGDDACPKKKGVASSDAKLNGCPPPAPPKDTDADGIPDPSDACPRKKGVASDDPKSNGCPVPPPPPPPKDTDADGIVDAEDACPRKAGVASDNPKLNGCPAPVAKAVAVPKALVAPKAIAAAKAPPPDSDGDGIPDSLDACPQQAGVHSGVAKKNGCPMQLASAAAGGPAELTFAGFRSFDDGTSLVFIELSGPVTVDVKKVRGAMVYTLENTKVPVRNNRNPLLTIDFSSIVRAATIAQKKKAVEISIALKADVEPEHRLVQRGGATVLEIQLPKAPPAPPPTAPVAPKSRAKRP